MSVVVVWLVETDRFFARERERVREKDNNYISFINRYWRKKLINTSYTRIFEHLALNEISNFPFHDRFKVSVNLELVQGW